MSQKYEDSSSSRSSTAEAPRPEDTQTHSRYQAKVSYSARHEAKQLLDEIAGVAPDKRRSKPQVNGAKLLRNILLFPITLLVLLAKLVTRPFRKADFALFNEMRKFLAHPGNFFWFNRLAPQAASRHFRTSSTEAMTHHARRYAAHIAVVGLAVVVVLGGGFSGAVRQLISPDAYVQATNGQLSSGGFLTVTGNMKGIVLNSLGTSSSGPKRVKEYTVQAGDTLRDLATKNNISLDSILYANQIDDPDYELKVGDKLAIPPVTGMWYVCTRNSFQIDTIASIASTFQVDPKVIIDYAPNQLSGVGINTPLDPGRDVMVPGGKKPYRDTLLVYTVREGENLDYIAGKFGVSPDTIAIFNDDKITDGETVKAGMQLTILPISGIRVKVLPSDNVTSIARRFSVPPENIVSFPMNNLKSKDDKLTPGDWLIVPNGIVPEPPKPVIASGSTGTSGNSSNKSGGVKEQTRYVYVPPPPKPATVSKSSSGSSYGNVSAAPPGAPTGTTGQLIWPLRGLITTYYGQPIWYGIHQGLDIAAAVNTPVHAADGGVVVFASWSTDGYGNMVMIAHSNGLYTLYGHLNQINVRVGQQVSKGQLIGLEGSTGNSTGPHLHFEVRYGRVYGQTYNPLRYLQ